MSFKDNNDDDDDFFIRPQNEVTKSAISPASAHDRDDANPTLVKGSKRPSVVGDNAAESAANSEDPCVDPPEVEGGETTAIEYDDPSETFIFPMFDNTSRATDVSRMQTARVQRENLFISQQYYYDADRRLNPATDPLKPRSAPAAYGSLENMNSRAPQILIDPFRYAAGLVYEHLDSTTIELPSGTQRNAVVGSPKYIASFRGGSIATGRMRTRTSSEKGLIIQVKAGTFFSPEPYRGQGLESRVIISDIMLTLNPNELVDDYRQQDLPSQLQRTGIQIQDGAHMEAAQLFADEYLLGNTNANTLINTDRSSDQEGRFLGQQYLFEDYTFVAPASFFEGELSEGVLQPVDISSVRSFYYENEENALNLGADASESANFQEYSIPSLYRKYALDLGAHSMSAGRRVDLNIERLNCPENDIVQKFPSDRVDQLTSINRLFFSDDVLNTPSENIWLQRNLGPYNKIQFNMSSSPIAELLSRSKVDTILLEMIESKSHYNPTYYTQILDQTVKFKPNPNDDGLVSNLASRRIFLDARERDSLGDVINDRVSINLRPNEYHNPLSDLKRFLNQPPLGPRDLYDFVVDEDEYPLSFFGSETIEEDPTGLELQKTLRGLYRTSETDRDLDNFVLDRERNYHEIFKQRPSYSEVIAYRVEKIEASTQEVLQNFYFFNSQNVERFSFIDKQVITGREYIYKIYCLNLVIGCTYEYLPRILEISSNADSYDFHLRAKAFRSLKIVETPFFEQEVKTALKRDLPPLSPSVHPYRGGSASEAQENNHIFEMSSNIGSSTEIPIIIKDTDRAIITETLRSQRANGAVPPDSQKIKYKSDSIPSHYEMIMINHPPTEYSDFSSVDSVIVESSSPLIEFASEPNAPKYVIFRAHDASGISNPTAVYRFENVDSGNGSFLSFERYEMFDLLDDIISFERNISIEPAFDQGLLDFRTLIEDLGDGVYDSAPRSETEGPMNLGIQDASIWGEQFIFRVTSTYSGRSFDLSVIFNQEDRGESEPAYRDQDQYSSELCENEALEKEEERRDNRREADDYLDRLNRRVITSPANNDLPAGPDREGADLDPVRELDIPNEDDIQAPEPPDLPEAPDVPSPPGGRQPDPPPRPPPRNDRDY
jgi:hypothetical protein